MAGELIDLSREATIVFLNGYNMSHKVHSRYVCLFKSLLLLPATVIN